MKWIGQHIWSLISRFRSDVYLESVDSGTIASGGNLGLDSNNKIVKSASPSGTIDLTSEVTGTLPVSSGGTGATSLADNSILTGTGTSAITAEANFTYNGTALSINALTSTFTNATNSSIVITNTGNNTAGGVLDLVNDRTAGVDGDTAGTIRFYGNDDGGNATLVGRIESDIGETADGSERAVMRLKSLSGGQQEREGLVISSPAGNDIINVDIGFGATSLTTIVGDLDIDGDAITSAGALTITPGGAFSVAGGANEIDLTTTGTLDINANSLDMDLTDSSSITITSSEDAEDFLIRQSGAHDASIILDAAGTGSDAIRLDATAGGVTFNTDDILVKSNTAAHPQLELLTTHDGNKPTFLVLNKKRDSSGGQDGDGCGQILFKGEDAGGIDTNYASILTTQTSTVQTDEYATFQITAATSDGSAPALENVIQGVGEASVRNINTTIGAGATSMCTIAGNLDVTGTPRVGWHGSRTRMKILPRDFVANDGGRPVMIEDDNVGSNELFLFSHSSFDMFAYLPIPVGYKATAVRIYGSDTSQDFYVYEGDINSKTITDVATGSTNIGSEKTLATEVTCDATNYLIVRVTSDGATDEIYGGYVVITEV